jgi:hypothetical protein
LERSALFELFVIADRGNIGFDAAKDRGAASWLSPALIGIEADPVPHRLKSPHSIAVARRRRHNRLASLDASLASSVSVRVCHQTKLPPLR